MWFDQYVSNMQNNQIAEFLYFVSMMGGKIALFSSFLFIAKFWIWLSLQPRQTVRRLGLMTSIFGRRHSGSQSLSFRSSCINHNGGRSGFDCKTSKVEFLWKFNCGNRQNETEYNTCMTMDSRFYSGTQLGQSYVPISAGYPTSSFPNEPYGKSTSSASIALDENLSRLFECMRLEYGT